MFKICRYCGKKFFKRDFPRVFQRMISCGSIECKYKHCKAIVMSGLCCDCGVKITSSAKRCRKCCSMGKLNPFYGKTHSIETKGKLKLFVKGQQSLMKGRSHSLESNIKNSVSHQKDTDIKPIHFGKNLKNAIRNSTKYFYWRQGVFIKNNFTCQNKKCNKFGVSLEVHHKISFGKLFKEALLCSPLLDPYEACMLYEPFWEINNGITLCVSCHRRKIGSFICKK